jgi:rhodanese-related sulfurtransferase
MKSISPLELYELVRQGQSVDLIDVRTPAEFEEVHADLAVSVPLDGLDPARIAKAREAGGQPLYLICRSGGRSQHACEQFVAAGYPNVVNVDGGTLAWLEANLPVVWNDPMASGGGESGCNSPSCGCRTKNA